MLGILAQGWHLLTAFALYALLARRFGPTRFGEWRVVITLLGWFEVFVTAGIAKVMTKRMSEATGDRGRLSRVGYATQAAVSLLVFGAVQVAAGPIAAGLGDTGLAPLIRISALDIPLFGLFMVASGVVLGEQRFSRQAGAWLVYASAKAVFIVAFVLGGFSVPGALLGNALSSLVGFAAVFVPVRLRPGEVLEGTASLARWMLLASVPFLTLSLLDGLGQNVDLWIFSGLVGGGGVALGLYASATILAEVPVFLFVGLNRVIFPAVAKARSDGDLALSGEYAKLGVRTAVIVVVIGVAFVAAAGRQVLTLVFSSAYAEAVLPLVLLMAAGLGRTVLSTCGEVFMAQDRGRAAISTFATAVVAQVALVLLLATRFGAAGAAAGAASGSIVSAGVAVWLLRDLVGARPLSTFARCVAAAAVSCAPIVLLSPSPPWLILAVPVALAAYFGLLRLFGEFSPEEIAGLRSALRRGRVSETPPGGGDA